MAKKTAGKVYTKKRKGASKGGRNARSGQKAEIRGVIGIAVLCVGLLALACQFIPSSGGFLNQCMLFVRGLGGSLCLLLPIVVCASGVVLVFFENGRMSARAIICGALLFVFAETLFQLFQVGNVFQAMAADGSPATYGSFLARSYWYDSLNCRGGGLIGALLAWPLYTALDVWGSVIVLVFAAVMVLMVLTGVSFGEVGMGLSEQLDDWRVQWKERREEREALRKAQEEEALEEERRLAEQRQQRRKEREAELAAREQEIREEQARRREQEAQQADRPGEAPQSAPERKRKGGAKLTVIKSEEAAEEILLQEPRPRKSAAKPKKPRAHINEAASLYIERADEFERGGIETYDEQFEYADPRDYADRPEFTVQKPVYYGGEFTMEEAENEFLYGMDSGAQPVQTAQPAQPQQEYNPYARPQEPYIPYEPQPLSEPQRGFSQTEIEQIQQRYSKPARRRTASAKQSVPVAVQETPIAPMEEAIVPSAQPEALMPEEPEQEAADALHGIDAQTLFAQDEPQPEDWLADAWQPDEPEPADEPEEIQKDHEPNETFSPFSASSYTKPSSIPARPQVRRENPQQRPAVQNVLAAQEEQNDQPIVQLRGNRLDGTPLVMPKKDTHEAPKVMEDAYLYPPIDLLRRSNATQDPNMHAKIEAGAQKLLSTLESFGVQAKLLHVTHGPAITRYELQPAPGVKVSRIVNLVDDIALNMASDGVRIEAPIPGKPAVGIEIPNEKIEMVSLRDVLESPEMAKQKSPTAVALGKGISGTPVVADLVKMPHVLIAGATGSGKSVCINTIINSIIYRASPSEVRLILIDPKVVELSVYNGIPHLLVPVVTDPKKASAALSWAVVEMEHRYKRFETMGVRNIEGYNKAIGENEEPMSKIIVIIDELADLMMVAPGEVEESICRLAQLARAAGIHLVIATQRPSVNVITGVIKANIPSRIAFAVSSQIDSRTILDSGGAEKLLGKGDMLYAPQGAGKPTRVQGCFVSDDEVQDIVDYVRGNHNAEYNEDVIEQMNTAAEEDKAAAGDAPASGEPVDEMLSKAIELAVEAGQVSISMLQRRLRVGYARAGRLVDEMTLRGITAEAEGPTKPRTVLISREEWRRMQENQE